MTRISRWLPASTLSVGLVASSLVVLAPAQANLETEAEPEVLLDANTTWRYLDDGTDPSNGLPSRTDWADPEFDDSNWPEAAGSFGAVRGELTELSGGYVPDNRLDQYKPDSTENKEAFFFRSEFTIDTDQINDDAVVTGAVRYDDAAIVYVNGERVDGFDDEDLPFTDEGEDRNMVYGGSNASAPKQGEFVIEEDLLEDGANTIAVQLHQGRSNSSDIYFGLEHLSLEIVEAEGQTAQLLQMGANSSERRLSWLTDSGIEESVQLAAGAHTTMPDSATTIAATQQGESAHQGKQFVHATLSGLTPGTYSYRVGSEEGGWSDIEQFEIFENDVEHTFTFIGDAQIGASGNVERDGLGWQAALDANDALFPESQFLLSAGDQVNDYSGSIAEYLAYLAPQQMRTQASAATLGNHDYNRSSPQALYGQHFNQPNMADYDPTEGSYWFIYNDVLHLNISTENRDWEGHRNFLETTIAEHGDDVQWTMLTFHRPLYSTGPHSVSGTTNEIRDGLSPIISDLDIDVVLTGHDHTYSRSFLIDSEGNQVDPATSEVVVNAEGEVVGAPEETEGLNLTYEGREASPRLEEGTHVRVTPEEGSTLFVTANSSTGSKYYDLRHVDEFRDGFQPRFRDQQYEQNITGVEVNQCSVTTSTVELDGTVVDKVELLRDREAPVITSTQDTVVLDDEFDPLAGLEISDNCADVSLDDVQVEGADQVNTAVLGQYSVMYRLADEAGNETSFERVITVTEADEEGEAVEEEEEEETPTPTPTPEPTEETGDEDERGNDENADENPAAADRDGDLANTGASILWAVAIGLAALVIGLMLFLVKRHRMTS
ncbi:MAG TPA: metallophosphoesterase [Enteractinococcus sp.]